MEEKEKTKLPTWSIFALSVIGIIYLLNPTAGVFEFIPDNLPFVGNLDEGAAAYLVWQGINQLRQLKNTHN